MSTRPRFVYVIVAAAAVTLLLSALIATLLQRMADAETQRDCERAVVFRDDGRAMWLYLIGEAKPDQTPEEEARFDAFVAELNKRLPPLRCVDGNPVPDTDPDA